MDEKKIKNRLELKPKIIYGLKDELMWKNIYQKMEDIMSKIKSAESNAINLFVYYYNHYQGSEATLRALQYLHLLDLIESE